MYQWVYVYKKKKKPGRVRLCALDLLFISLGSQYSRAARQQAKDDPLRHLQVHKSARPASANQEGGERGGREREREGERERETEREREGKVNKR